MRFLILFLLSVSMYAQQQRTVTLTWEQGEGNPPSTTTDIYRSNGTCSGTPNFAKIASGVVGTTYTDDTVTAGNYCYAAKNVVDSLESDFSNFAPAPIKPKAPKILLPVTVQ